MNRRISGIALAITLLATASAAAQAPQGAGRGGRGGAGQTVEKIRTLQPDLHLIAVTDATPIVDFANGGSAVEWTRALDGVLALDFEMAIPGRGEPKTRAEVEAYRDRFATLSAGRAKR